MSESTFEGQLTQWKATAMTWLERGTDVAKAIHDQLTFEAAKIWCQDRKEELDQIESFLNPHIKNARVVWDGLCKDRRDATEPRERAIAIVKSAMGKYEMEKERLRRLEEEKLMLAKKKEAEEQALRAAAEMEKQGNKTMANAILDSAHNFAPPVIPIEKTKGVSTRLKWRVRVTDKRALLKFIADGPPGNENAVEVNTTWLDNQAKLMDGNMKSWAGIETYQEPIVSLGRKTA